MRMFMLALLLSFICFGAQAADDPAGTPGTGGTEAASEGEETMNQAEQDRRIDYIEFLTTDIGVTKKFYSELFGWVFTDYGPDYTSFSDGRMNGGFVKAEEVATVGYPLIVLYSTDLEKIRDRVVESDGKIVKDIFEFPGGRRFHFTDPSGNELAIWSDK